MNLSIPFQSTIPNHSFIFRSNITIPDKHLYSFIPLFSSSRTTFSFRDSHACLTFPLLFRSIIPVPVELVIPCRSVQALGDSDSLRKLLTPPISSSGHQRMLRILTSLLSFSPLLPSPHSASPYPTLLLILFQVCYFIPLNVLPLSQERVVSLMQNFRNIFRVIIFGHNTFYC